MIAKAIEDLDDLLLIEFMENAVGISYQRILHSEFFKGDRTACDKYFKECIEEDFLELVEDDYPKTNQKKNRRVYRYTDPEMAFRRIDSYIAQGRWKWHDDKEGLERLNRKSLIFRGSPRLRDRIIFFLYCNRRALCLDDSEEPLIFPKPIAKKRRVKEFLNATGKLLKDGLLEFKDNQIVASLRGLHLADRMYKNCML